ncbi:hypothetical protein X777_14812 [Ooceraea biroi]|uniref:DUF4817 domain-containing protein n=1 Tax=Ooceraea biroi TaxID=2015173 RepID=A0A026WRT9_OOCBI|nr:hypothetical protein X777_14812 [Ooceraea biroi]
MPRTYSNVEYADMVFVYGFCDGNAREAVREYARRFPTRAVRTRCNACIAKKYKIY